MTIDESVLRGLLSEYIDPIQNDLSELRKTKVVNEDKLNKLPVMQNQIEKLQTENEDLKGRMVELEEKFERFRTGTMSHIRIILS